MVDTSIRQVRGRQVWDSRGRPTVEADVVLGCGARGRAIAPAGASTGAGEAIDLRDGGKAQAGLGVTKAIHNINGEISNALGGRDAADQEAIDSLLIELDGTPNKSRLGGNATIAVSMATLHASAAAHHEPLWRYLAQDNKVSIPLPEIQIFGGGAHAGNRVDIQDFMIVCPSARSFSEALEMTSSVYRCAARSLSDRGLLQGVADEGGLWPAFDSNAAVLDALVRAIEDAGYVPGTDISISLDVAASQLRDGDLYRLRCEDKVFGKDEWIELLGRWIDRYPIVSIEDPLAEDDTAGFIEFTKLFGTRVQTVGDDYLVTNAARVRQAAADGACNAVLIKPNQAGTITETYAALKAAKDSGFATIISARSGETEDVTIAHLAVGWNAGQLKVGSFSRSERMAKWNEVLRIAESMNSQDALAGLDVLKSAG